MATNQLDMAMAESARSALSFTFGDVSKKVLCSFKMSKVLLQVVSKLGSRSASGFALARDQVFYFE